MPIKSNLVVPCYWLLVGLPNIVEASQDLVLNSGSDCKQGFRSFLRVSRGFMVPAPRYRSTNPFDFDLDNRRLFEATSL